MANAKKKTVTLTLPDGTRKYYRGKTKKEAQQKRDADKLAICLGVDVGSKVTFKAMAEVWYETRQQGKVQTRSAEESLGILNRYILPALGHMDLADIRPLHIERLMSSVADKSYSTQRKVLQETKAVLRMAVDNGVIPRLPVSSELKAGGSQPAEVPPLTDAQLEQLLQAVYGTRVYLFVLTLALAGLRKGEALGLMWKDIDWDNGLLNVQRSIIYPKGNMQGEINTKMKSDAAHRVIPLDPQLQAALAEEKRHSKSLYVFSGVNGSFLSAESYRNMWKLIDARTIGTNIGRDLTGRTLNFSVHPHQLRHTCITNWMRNGMHVKEIQYLAGHATLEMTLKVYSHYQRELEQAATAERVRKSRENLAIPG